MLHQCFALTIALAYEKFFDAMLTVVIFPEAFDGPSKEEGWDACLRVGPTAAVATVLVLGWEAVCSGACLQWRQTASHPSRVALTPTATTIES